MSASFFAVVVIRLKRSEGVLTQDLRDINFTPTRPHIIKLVPGEHPDRRPEAVALGDFGTGLYFAVLLNQFGKGLKKRVRFG